MRRPIPSGWRRAWRLSLEPRVFRAREGGVRRFFITRPYLRRLTMPRRLWLSGAAVFLAAALLFVVQPLAARSLLPWYGGAPMVWGGRALLLPGGAARGVSLRAPAGDAPCPARPAGGPRRPPRPRRPGQPAAAPRSRLGAGRRGSARRMDPSHSPGHRRAGLLRPGGHHAAGVRVGGPSGPLRGRQPGGDRRLPAVRPLQCRVADRPRGVSAAARASPRGWAPRDACGRRGSWPSPH